MGVFGTVGIFVREMSLPSGFIAMARGFLGAGFIFLFMLLLGRLPSLSSIKKNLLPLILSGAFIGINWILLFESYSYVGVSTATLCYYMAPIFVIIASPFVLSERVGGIRLICVAVALVGMILVSEPWKDDFSDGSLIGILLALGAALFYASVTLTNKKMKDISSTDLTVVQLFVAAVVITPYTLIAERTSGDMFDSKTVILLVTLGILHTGVCYLLYFSSIKGLSAETVAIFGYIDPIVALLLSALILSEKMTPFGIIGAVLILFATLASEILPSVFQGVKEENTKTEN